MYTFIYFETMLMKFSTWKLYIMIKLKSYMYIKHMHYVSCIMYNFLINYTFLLIIHCMKCFIKENHKQFRN